MDNSTFSKIINSIKFQYKFEYALMLLFFLALYIDQRVFYITFDLETKRDRSDKSDISRVYYYRNEKWSLYFRGLSPRISRNSNQCTLFKKSNEIKNRGSSQSTNTTPIFFSHKSATRKRLHSVFLSGFWWSEKMFSSL